MVDKREALQRPLKGVWKTFKKPLKAFERSLKGQILGQALGKGLGQGFWARSLEDLCNFLGKACKLFWARPLKGLLKISKWGSEGLVGDLFIRHLERNCFVACHLALAPEGAQGPCKAIVRHLRAL